MYRFLIYSGCMLTACTNQHPSGAAATTITNKDSASSGNITSTATTLPTDSAITSIRNAFRQINEAHLKSQQFKWTAENCNNEGTATFYLTDANEIVKVVETGAIGDGAWTTAYYYQNGRFIFSLETDTGGPAAGPDITTATRKYVYKDKVIRRMENDTYTTTTDSVLTNASKEYKILEAYTSKNFEAAFCE